MIFNTAHYWRNTFEHLSIEDDDDGAEEDSVVVIM